MNIFRKILLILALVLIGIACEEVGELTTNNLTPPTDLTATAEINGVTLAWTASSNTSVAGYKIRQTVEGTTTDIAIAGRTTASHTITGLTAGTEYSFTISAVTGSTESAQSAPVTATPTAQQPVTPPAQQPAQQPVTPPAAPEVTAAPADGQVTLSWQAVSGATSYKVYQGTSDNEVQNITEGTTAVITGLTNDQTYSFWVAAVNSGGSTLSAEATATPLAAVPPAPTGMTAVIGDAQVVLTWTASTHALVTGYKIRTMSGIADVDISGRETATGTVTGLTNGTAYSFTIAAIAGDTESPQSTTVTATPLAPPVVTATAADSQVTLSWVAVTGATSYKVYQGTNSNEILTDSSITATNAVVTGLTNDQAYSFWVSAVNSSGSVQSAEVTATPAAPTEVPAVPTNLIVVAGVQQVILSWQEVTGAASYKVYQDGTALTPLEAITTPSYTVTGLTSGTSYSFTVSAVNSVGESTQSTAATATPIPPAVTGLMATAGAEQVALTWTASADTAVTAYTIRTTGGESSIADTAAAGRTRTSGTVTGLSAGVEYSFTIVAVAYSTESLPSDAVTATPTAVQAIPVPQNVQATAGINRVTLAWDAVDGAMGYYIYKDGTYAGNTRSTPYTVTGLKAGTEYSFTVRAYINSAQSAHSAEAKATPLPPAPTNVRATSGINRVTLTWTASSAEGVTGYTIRQTVDGTTTDIAVTGRSTATYIVRGLTAGKSHSFTIAAVAGSTESAQSDPVTAVPALPVPTGFTATAGWHRWS